MTENAHEKVFDQLNEWIRQHRGQLKRLLVRLNAELRAVGADAVTERSLFAFRMGQFMSRPLAKTIGELLPGILDGWELQNPASMSEIELAFGYLVTNRQKCAEIAKEYHRQYDTRPDFPLIVPDGGLPNKTIALEDVERRLTLVEASRGSPPPAASAKVFGSLLANHDLSARTIFDYQRKRLSKQRPEHKTAVQLPQERLWDGQSFRLIEVGMDGSVPSFKCSMTTYSAFVNTCKAIEIELAISTMKKEADRPKLPLRGNPAGVFDLSANNAIPGLNCLVVCHRSMRPDTFSFYLMERSKSVAQAEGTIDVVPAGAFQPDQNIMDFAREFSIKWSLTREFRQEMKGEADYKPLKAETTAAERLHRFTQFDERASFPLLTSNAVQWRYLGYGFDPLGLYPEILTLLICDRDDEEIKELFQTIEESWEGKVVPKRFDLGTIHTLIKDPRMAPSGQASLLLAAQHYDAIVRGIF